MKTYDVAVVGAGVAGCCIARELARYEVSVVVLEAGNDVACGATRANSGIVHAGFDPVPGSLKARYNVEGAALFPRWSKELGFAYERNGSIVVALGKDELPALEELLERGRANGVAGLSLLTGEEARGLEPNLSPEVVGALLAETGAICDPYEVAFAAAENAAANGVEFRFCAKATDVETLSEDFAAFRISLESGDRVFARVVVNAAGVHADEVNNLVSRNCLDIVPVRGEYCLYDSEYGGTFSRTVFQVPTARGKGVLVSPTVHGNLFVGPTSSHQSDKEDLSTTREGLDLLMRKGGETWPDAGAKGVITNFSGLRATGSVGDFVVGQAEDAPGFFNAACLDSPGLSSAPAIAVDISSQVAGFLQAPPRKGFNPMRAPARRFAAMDGEERGQAIAEDPAWGNVVCRCRKVTEAELVAALRGPLPVLSLDALKWRCGVSMGSCHGGFCTPEVVRIAARELSVSPAEIDKRLPGSYMVAEARDGYAGLSDKELPSRIRVRDRYDVVVVGAGAAGMAAARSASEKGASVLLVDRERGEGGILRQCVHNGFGLHRFSQELTGPEYAAREAGFVAAGRTDVLLGATVLELGALPDGADGRFSASLVCPHGAYEVAAGALVLATGSRERGFGSLNVAGSRPAGVYSAGTAQSLINLHGCLPGRRAVVLGSGDIGLIMARRMTLEGMRVLGVYEIAARASGLRRNVVQCLEDFGIPLHLSKTVVRVEGRHRLEAVWVASVDPTTWVPVEGTEERVECDTLVLSVGLVPENDLLRQLGADIDPVTGGARVDERMQTSVPGVFSCGNALHIHDLADHASAEGDVAGDAAARFALSRVEGDAAAVPVVPAEGVRYVVPHRVGASTRTGLSLSFRVSRVMRRPRMEVCGVRADGSRTLLAVTTGMVAVPAEMVRLSLGAQNLDGFARIEVSAVERGERG